MRRPSKIELTDEQRATLTIWLSAGKTEQRLAKRAQVIMCAADGIREALLNLPNGRQPPIIQTSRVRNRPAAVN